MILGGLPDGEKGGAGRRAGIRLHLEFDMPMHGSPFLTHSFPLRHLGQKGVLDVSRMSPTHSRPRAFACDLPHPGKCFSHFSRFVQVSVQIAPPPASSFHLNQHPWPRFYLLAPRPALIFFTETISILAQMCAAFIACLWLLECRLPGGRHLPCLVHCPAPTLGTTSGQRT